MSDCVMWQGNLQTNGYGRWKVNGKTFKAHRLFYEMFHGPIPPSMLVCHHCDNPSCVNPDHLFLGTVQDNMRDCFLKGRRASGLHNGRHTHPEKTARGIRVTRARLTDDNIREIRHLRTQGWTQQAIASKFNTPQTNISRILLGQTWKHVI